jgi:hypothetical protein
MTTIYNDEEVVEFISKCPVEGCNNELDINWNHVGCSSKEYINSEGDIICTECKRKFGFYEAVFNCGSHENYKPPSKNPQRLIAAFAIMGRLKSGGGKKFLKKLMNNLLDKCEDDDDDDGEKKFNNYNNYAIKEITKNRFIYPIQKYDFPDFK